MQKEGFGFDPITHFCLSSGLRKKRRDQNPGLKMLRIFLTPFKSLLLYADDLIRCQKNLDFTLLFQMPCATGVQRKMIQLNSSYSLFGHSWNIRNLGNKKRREVSHRINANPPAKVFLSVNYPAVFKRRRFPKPIPMLARYSSAIAIFSRWKLSKASQ